MEIRFKRFKRTDEFKAWLLSLDNSVRTTLPPSNYTGLEDAHTAKGRKWR